MDTLQFILKEVVLPLIVGFLGWLAYPRIDFYLKNRSDSAKERKIKALLIRYINIKNQMEHPVLIKKLPRYHDWLPIISAGLFFLIYTLLPNFSWFRFVLVLIAMIPMNYALVQLLRGIADKMDLLYFDAFKRRTIKKLKRLGSNPKDYGIE